MILLFFPSKMENKPNYEEQYSFRCAINIVQQWRQMVTVNVDYLRQLDKPVEKVKIHYTTITTTTKNYSLIECSYSNINYISAGATDVLLQDHIVQQVLINGYVGHIEKIVYHSHMV